MRSWRSAALESSDAAVELQIDSQIKRWNGVRYSCSGCLESKNFFKIDEREVRSKAFLLHPFETGLNKPRRQFPIFDVLNDGFNEFPFLVATSEQNRIELLFVFRKSCSGECLRCERLCFDGCLLYTSDAADE